MNIPPYLKFGDTIGIVAPARKIMPSEIEDSLKWWKEKGFQIVLGEHLFDSENQFAGTDENRALDFQKMLDNPNIKAIFCARGGYGTLRIIDKLEFLSFNLDPKWICGYSDITVLHAHLQSVCNVSSIHSAMPISTNETKEVNFETLYQTLIGENPLYKCKPHSLNKIGNCLGQIIGGNLSILYALSGSVSEIDTKDKILFIEDVDEYLYHIDRMILQFKRSGKLENLAGLLVGDFTKMRDNEVSFGKSFEEIIYEHCEEYSFPIAFNFPAGHSQTNCALKMGAKYELRVENNKTTLQETT